MANILICEDEHIVALDIRRHLERFGYVVIGSVATGEEAVELSSSRKPDLVLMDIHLQGSLDGVDAAHEIYESLDIPVILLTAYADEETISRAKISQPFGYIIKPFEERELRTSIELALYRHKMNKDLRRSEERYRELFEEAPSANFTASVDGSLLACNHSFLKLLDYDTNQAVLGKHISDFFQDKADFLIPEASFNEFSPAQTLEWKLKDRKGRPIIVLATIVINKSSNPEAELRGYLVDITERRELENQLRQAQKMEAIGRLAGGIAHDFNNILTAVLGYCNLLAEEISDEPALLDEVKGIQAAANRAVNLTRQLLTFSRKQALEPRLVDANSIIKDLEKMARRLVSETISLKFYYDAARSVISIDPGQFEQVLINLIVNAKDAISNSGSIVIETSNILIKNNESGQGLKNGSWLVLTVRDSGQGIDSDNLPRIFEPFFTTKQLGRGTGLGLSTVYAIIDQSGGTIRVESEKGKGTSFFVYLPVSAGQALPTIREDSRTNELRSGSILLTEDDDYLRGLLSRIMSKAGYRVLEAENAGEAILIAEREKDFILVTDIVMPRINGYELASRLAAVRPSIRVLYMSGYQDNAVKIPLSPSIRTNFLQKPFTHEQLMSALASLEEPSGQDA